MSLLIACFCHDLDHRGYNNAYFVKMNAPLATLYSSSLLENHHFNQTLALLQIPGHNIFSHLAEQEYKKARSLMLSSSSQLLSLVINMKTLCLSCRTNWNWEVYLILLECFASGHSCMWLSYAILLYSWEVYSGQCMLLSQSQVLGIMKKAILATDLARFFGNKDCLQTILSSGEFSWENQEHR